MDNGDTCSLGDSEKMDANTVWQWRIMRANKYSKHTKPFHYSKEMGLDFTVGFNTQEKMNLQLVTNGVILEVCDFAKVVKKSKRHFIANILENNFDLGLKNEQQRIKFTSQILHKVKDLIQKPPKDKHEVFTLFDMSSKTEGASSSKNGQNMASIEHNTDSFQVDMDDTDENDHEEVKCSPAPSKENIKTEEMDGPCADDSDDEDEFDCSGVQSTKELGEDVLPPLYPCCKEIGLNLDVGSNQSLDPGLLTKGVMLELVHFTRVLTGSYRSIVLSVLEHKFDLDLKSQQGKNRVWSKVVDLLKRRERLLNTGTKISPEFKSEPFSFQTNPIKRASVPSDVRVQINQFKEVTKRRQSDLKGRQNKRTLSRTSEQITKRRRRQQSQHGETNTLSDHTDLCTSQTTEDNHCYMCPLDSDEVTDSENTERPDDLQNSTNSESPRESESGCPGTHGPFFATSDGSSSLPIVNSNVKPPFTSQTDKTVRSEDKKTQIPRDVPNKCEIEQDEIKNEGSVWKLRANRVKQILFLLDKEYCAFTRSKKIGLEFDVGFGPKQNFSGDSLGSSVLLEVAKFALAMNSSQQEFIMEILEYNFDFVLWTKKQRKAFTCEVMNRVRQLQNSEDAVKHSKEVFELPCPMSSVYRASQSMGCINPELSSISRTDKCDFAPVYPADSHIETKEHDVDFYPFCREIGLKLHVNYSQPNQKLEINKLTNGAMTEVINFAEKLCGTFEPICLDILRHNFDLDWLNGESELARTILAQIPLIMEQRNLSTCITSYRKMKCTRKGRRVKRDCQNNPNVDTCSTSQAPIIDQNVGNSTDTEQENELNLWLWKLRAIQINQILSVPHGEHCPFYSYSRCKKLGINFNVGSGVKQNLDPKLLTNGIMVEVKTFATALQSAQKDFITEILEYNFHLDLNNELYHSAFAQQIQEKVKSMKLRNKKSSIRRIKMPFELPDLRCIEESTYPKTKYCPKCYQDRHYKPHQEESDPGNMLHPRPHTMTDTVSGEARYTAQKPAKDLSSTFQAAEETIMDSYPCCKKIGLTLCVDKDKPKDKLDLHVLTWEVMNEVASFARRLCGTKNKNINDVLEHNFNFGMQSHRINPAVQFHRMTTLNDGVPSWFSEVFVVQPCPHRDPGDLSKMKEASATLKSERKETTKKRRLALQIKKEQATRSSDKMPHVIKSKKTRQRSGDCTPICTKIGLDLDVTSKSGGKDKLDINLLTRGAVMEIYRFAVKKLKHYFPNIVYEILDYNFDLSSQHHRRWEFSLAIASKVKALAKQHQRTLHRADEVFKLPFVFERKASKKLVLKTQNKKNADASVREPDKTTSEVRVVRQIRYHSDVNRVYFLDDVKTKEEHWFDEDTNPLTDPGTVMQMTGSPVSGGYYSPLQGNIHIKEEEHHENVKTEPNTEDVKYLVQGEPAGSLGYTLIAICPNFESNIKRESEIEDAKYYNLVEPQYAMLALCPNTESSVKIESDTEDVKYVVQGEAAGSQGYSIITMGQDTGSTLVRGGQGDVPVGLYHYGVVSNTESEVDIKQECDQNDGSHNRQVFYCKQINRN